MHIARRARIRRSNFPNALPLRARSRHLHSEPRSGVRHKIRQEAAEAQRQRANQLNSHARSSDTRWRPRSARPELASASDRSTGRLRSYVLSRGARND